MLLGFAANVSYARPDALQARPKHHSEGFLKTERTEVTCNGKAALWRRISVVATWAHSSQSQATHLTTATTTTAPVSVYWHIQFILSSEPGCYRGYRIERDYMRALGELIHCVPD